MTYKIATWNINSLRVRLPHLLTWLAEQQPEIVALQETKVEDPHFPVDAIKEAGYHVVYAGQKSYNGVAILSKMLISDVITDIPMRGDPQRRLLAATVGQLRIVNVYVPNGESPLSEKYQYKLQWLRHLTEYLQQQLMSYDHVVVLGDFNIAPEERDVHDPQAWAGQVLFSEPERQALQTLLACGLKDSFRLFEQPPKLYSWWDYRALAFRRNHGLRIDHILISNGLVQYCQDCYIDKVPRKWERPSDHAPVVASFLFNF